MAFKRRRITKSKTSEKANKFEISKMDISLTNLSSKEKSMFASDLNYDKKLSMTFYMEPIADSRPRVTGRVAISENIIILRKNFLPHYRASDLLKNLIIISPYHLRFKFFMSPSKKILKLLGYSEKGRHKPKHKATFNLFMKDKLRDLSIKDCDNMIKVYNDMLMTENARLVLDDGFNVGIMEVEKYVSLEPRVEMEVFYSTRPMGYYLMTIKDHSSYFKFNLSEKNMYIFKRTYKQELDHLKNILKIEFLNINTEKMVKDKIKQVATYFEDNWSSDSILQLINCIGNMKDYKKINKTTHIYVLLSYLLSFNHTATRILNATMDKYEALVQGGVTKNDAEW
ncbi:MAG: hypothetical protein ACRC92_20570 [Peptostreptococcaceae bacterium]